MRTLRGCLVNGRAGIWIQGYLPLKHASLLLYISVKLTLNTELNLQRSRSYFWWKLRISWILTPKKGLSVVSWYEERQSSKMEKGPGICIETLGGRATPVATITSPPPRESAQGVQPHGRPASVTITIHRSQSHLYHLQLGLSCAWLVEVKRA